MANIFLIQYKMPDESIGKKLQERVKTLGAWMSFFENFWILDTDKGEPQELYSILMNDIPEDKCRILIVKIDINSYWGFMPNEAWEWLKQRQKK